MGRKSLSEERAKQIINAFATCILKYGLHDSSLERIAEEAGVKRSIIRHYIGNRNEVLKALVDRITCRYIQELVAATESGCSCGCGGACGCDNTQSDKVLLLQFIKAAQIFSQYSNPVLAQKQLDAGTAVCNANENNNNN